MKVTRDSSEITRLLNAWVAGDNQALDAVTPLVYDELHMMAERIFSREREPQTLQPTALVNEAYEKLIGVDANWQDRSHFYALAARMMRRLLVNHAKSRKALKRGGEALRITLHEDRHGRAAFDEDILALDEALLELRNQDERKASILELHYFGGLTQEETALALDISESTVRRELRLAKIWLRKLLS